MKSIRGSKTVFSAAILMFVLTSPFVLADGDKGRGGEVGNRGNQKLDRKWADEAHSAIKRISELGKVVTNGTTLDDRCKVAVSSKEKSWVLSNVSVYLGTLERNTPRQTETSAGTEFSFKDPRYPSAETTAQCLSTSLALAVPTKSDVKNLPRSADGKIMDICWSITNGTFDQDEGKTYDGAIQVGLVPRQVNSHGDMILGVGKPVTDYPGVAVSGAKENKAHVGDFDVRVKCAYANQEELQRLQSQRPSTTDAKSKSVDSPSQTRDSGNAKDMNASGAK